VAPSRLAATKAFCGPAVVQRRGRLDRSEFQNGGVLHVNEKMKLQDSVIRSFRVAKVFRENSDYVNNMCFSSNGDSLITSSNDDSIVIYDTLEGK